MHVRRRPGDAEVLGEQGWWRPGGGTAARQQLVGSHAGLLGAGPPAVRQRLMPPALTGGRAGTARRWWQHAGCKRSSGTRRVSGREHTCRQGVEGLGLAKRVLDGRTAVRGGGVSLCRRAGPSGGATRAVCSSGGVQLGRRAVRRLSWPHGSNAPSTHARLAAAGLSELVTLSDGRAGVTGGELGNGKRRQSLPRAAWRWRLTSHHTSHPHWWPVGCSLTPQPIKRPPRPTHVGGPGEAVNSQAAAATGNSSAARPQPPLP